MACVLVGLSPISLAMSIFEAINYYNLNLMTPAAVVIAFGLVFNLLLSNAFNIILCTIYSKN